jgi:hypothetical protein
MFTTSTSKPPAKGNPRHLYHETEVQDTDPDSVAIWDEINLLISARNSALQYHDFVSASTEHSPESHRRARQELRQLVRNIASDGDLTSSSQSADEPYTYTYYYRTSYEVYSLPCTDRLSRPGVLTNAASLLGFMSTWQKRFRSALPEEHRTEHDRLYESTVTAFDAWLAVARPLVSPALSTLRNREHSGRLQPHARLPQLLEQLLRSDDWECGGVSRIY